MAEILIIGSQQAEREGLALVMEFAGHRCATAGSLREAANLLKKGSFELVLTDTVVGDDTSDHIAQALKAISATVSVVTLSEEAEPLGGDEVITLPFSPVHNLAPQMSTVGRREAFLALLPEQESLKMLSNLPRTPGLLNKLAVLYHSQEKYAGAEKLYKQALEVSKKAKGDQNREMASILNNLATLYHDQMMYEEAEPLYKKSLSIVEKVYGPNHLKVARRLRGLSDLYKARGRDSEAAPLVKRLRAIEKVV